MSVRRWRRAEIEDEERGTGAIAVDELDSRDRADLRM